VVRQQARQEQLLANHGAKAEAPRYWRVLLEHSVSELALPILVTMKG
jgi:hypothetical protein